MRGTETFYDEDRHMREWDTEAEAIEWAGANGYRVDSQEEKAMNNDTDTDGPRNA